jgi:hypothetical protein
MLLGAWRDVFRFGSVTEDRRVAMRPGASAEVEVERLVRDRLYGARGEVAATPLSSAGRSNYGEWTARRP